MELSKDLKLIKKYYGEDFMHLCRSMFPTILEKEGLLFDTLYKKIAPTKRLYDDVKGDVETFVDYVFSLVGIDNVGNNEPLTQVNKTPEQLFDEKGYILFPECQTEQDILEFEKYYARGEEICTFRGGRLELCRVWFAVKKDVDQIKRQNFTRPQRQDEYGTSVISLQFTRSARAELSIKNRYNHTVANPDATFSNCLENIAEGLTNAFKTTYGINLRRSSTPQVLEMANYVMDKNGRYHRYNVNVGGVYYCDGNKIIDFGVARVLDKDKYILMENYVVDLQQKTIRSHNSFWSMDSFLLSLGAIKDIKVSLDEKKNKKLTIIPEGEENIEITLNKYNEIIEYTNPNLERANYEFLYFNTQLKKFNAPNLIKVSNGFLMNNKKLEEFNAPNVVKIGDYCLKNNHKLQNLDLPKLKSVGESFLFEDKALTNVNLPQLEILGACSFYVSNKIDTLYLPNVKTIEEGCFYENNSLKAFYAPQLTKIGKQCMFLNDTLKVLHAPKLKRIGANTLYHNTTLEQFEAHKIKRMGKNVLLLNSNFDDKLNAINIEKTI